MFDKILIANRGEIACRVAATARRLGVRTVAVYSDADAQALHVQACDEAVRLGGAPVQDSYLQWPRILAAAQTTGAQAVHPGYGFLSENAAFARACAQAGLVFIGPPPDAIAAMGSKSAAKALMAQAGVPLVPGYHGDSNEPALLLAEAARIGYPVLIKASAGGGGKGMRRVERAEDFAAALASCQREARASFGDDQVLVERYVMRPRHIEIQVFADTHGRCLHLFERDCSVQRRHQKVLEEAPAPGLSAAQRAAMGAAAVAAAQAVGYVGAGTVEFIAEPVNPAVPDQTGCGLRFYFMEMNTRLQVEHPVTEAITGYDLVEWQLRVASGEPLPAAQGDIAARGHAIEARLCAENPDADFLPATGRLAVLRWPAHVRFMRNADGEPFHDPAPVRIDAGVREGDTVTPHYDPMLAKLIVWGADRAQALARLDAALRDTHVLGPANNVAFLRRVVQSRAFASADLDTALIERERAALFGAPPLPPEVAAAGLIAHTLSAEASAGAARAQAAAADPWSRADGWRANAPARRLFEFEADGQRHQAWLIRPNGLDRAAGLRLSLGERSWALGLQSAALAATGTAGAGDPGSPTHDVLLDHQRLRLTVYADGGPSDVTISGISSQRVAVFAHAAPQPGGASATVLRWIDPFDHAADGAVDTGGRLTAPMPGTLIACLAETGQQVEAGQPLAVMEAMKMEHTLTAPHAGRLTEWLFAVGDQVTEGSELLRLQANPQEPA
jgi:3-methylcrotonyl-CoA carboxylase alpha subunit